MRRVAAAALLVFLLPGCDRTRSGRTAWDAGRLEDARRAFAHEVEDAGSGASQALLFDHALASLATGRWTEADDAAARAMEGDDQGVAGLAAFVRGHVAFERSRLAEVEAARPGADATTAARALADAEDALAFWSEAVLSRSEWPEARRNVERALLRLAGLRERQRADAPDEGPGDGPEAPPPPDGPPLPDRPRPPPPTPVPPDPTPTPTGAEVVTQALPAEAVPALVERLRAMEAERERVRRARRDERSASVERDW